MSAPEFIAAINADTPKAFYKCQEASGTIVDSVSGSGQNLTNLNGTIAYQQAGPMSDFSIRFNLTGYAFSNAAASVVTDNFTLGYFAKLGGGSISNGRPSFRNGGGGNRGFEIEMDLNGTFYYVPNSGGSGTPGANSTGALTTSGFKLIHLVRRSGVTEYYINGVVDNSSAGGSTPTAALSGDTVQLGASIELDIYIAYAFIFESALSASRIKTHYVAAVGPYMAEVMADTPKGYWRMNDASGNPQDSSGLAHHVTSITGTPTYSQASPITTDASAQSILLPNGAYFSVPDHADWDINGSNDAVTIEAWVKRTDTAVSTNVVSKQANSYLMSIYDTDDKLHLVQSQNTEVSISTNTINETTDFHYVVVGYDNTSEAAVVYIDGVQQGNDQHAPGSMPFLTDNASALLIGSDTTTSAHGTMYICEVAVYLAPDILAPSRIAAHYAAATAGKQSFYVARRKMVNR